MIVLALGFAAIVGVWLLYHALSKPGMVRWSDKEASRLMFLRWLYQTNGEIRG